MLAQAIKRRLGKEENQKGFTLIELLAVIVILGIIAVIAIPMIGGIINNTKEDADAATARQIYDAARLYITSESNGVFDPNSATTGDVVTVTIAQLRTGNYLEAELVLPSNKNNISSGTVTFTDGVLSALTLNSRATSTSTEVLKTFVAADVLKASK